jgi:hypothetical protein
MEKMMVMTGRMFLVLNLVEWRGDGRLECDVIVVGWVVSWYVGMIKEIMDIIQVDCGQVVICTIIYLKSIIWDVLVRVKTVGIIEEYTARWCVASITA